MKKTITQEMVRDFFSYNQDYQGLKWNADEDLQKKIVLLQKMYQDNLSPNPKDKPTPVSESFRESFGYFIDFLISEGYRGETFGLESDPEEKKYCVIDIHPGKEKNIIKVVELEDSLADEAMVWSDQIRNVQDYNEKGRTALSRVDQRDGRYSPNFRVIDASKTSSVNEALLKNARFNLERLIKKNQKTAEAYSAGPENEFFPYQCINGIPKDAQPLE